MININATFILTMINFVLLVVILRVLLFKPLLTYLDERAGTIAESLRQAGENKARAAKIADEKAGILLESRIKASEIIDRAAAAAADESRAILDKTREETQAMITAAQNEMLADADRIKRSLRRDLAGMVVSLSEKVLDREIAEKDHRRLIEEGLDALGE